MYSARLLDANGDIQDEEFSYAMENAVYRIKTSYETLKNNIFGIGPAPHTISVVKFQYVDEVEVITL
jgi:hypothetical protein